MLSFVSRRGFSAAARAPALRISEIFSSVQGEGPFVGRPSIFLRLGMCNLECAWCDTKYTWLFSDEMLSKVKASVPEGRRAELLDDTVYNKQEELRRASVEDTVQEIITLAKQGPRAVVITGGEPLLHKRALLRLVPLLRVKGFQVEFETNGTLSPSGLEGSHAHFNVSPKLSNSFQSEKARLKPEVLRQFAGLGPRAVFKFVVDSQDDLDEVTALVEMAGIPRERVYLMPQGTSPEAVATRGAWLADICRDTGFNYSHRLHVTLWGDKRGV